jgi:hypothetical protein
MKPPMSHLADICHELALRVPFNLRMTVLVSLPPTFTPAVPRWHHARVEGF